MDEAKNLGQLQNNAKVTSTFDLIEFSLDRAQLDGKVLSGSYGVNVAKVREVIRLPEINPMHSKARGVVGLFELRGVPIPAIDLSLILGDGKVPDAPNRQIIVTEFSKKRAGFIVKATHRIRRISWEKVLPAASDKESCMSGMCMIEDHKFLFILDLEKILLNLEDQNTDFPQHYPEASIDQPASRKGFHILLVDDSELILSNATKILRKEGYTVTACSNGKLAKKVLDEGEMEHIDLVVTDIEMPQMDGLSLAQYIKAHHKFKDTPVILHSSLSGDANLSAARAVGADGYIVKNDYMGLLGAIESYRGKAG